MKTIEIPIDVENDTHIPTYSSAGASGADVRAFIDQSIRLVPGASILVPTGVKVAIPQGYEIQVRPRSGLALKNQITVLNTPGTVDADYRGDIGVILINHGQNDFIIEPEMRVAQLVLTPVYQAEFVLCKDLNTTSRGSGGFGHTGTH